MEPTPLAAAQVSRQAPHFHLILEKTNQMIGNGLSVVVRRQHGNGRLSCVADNDGGDA
jgi:hypothetical protein